MRNVDEIHVLIPGIVNFLCLFVLLSSHLLNRALPAGGLFSPSNTMMRLKLIEAMIAQLDKLHAHEKTHAELRAWIQSMSEYAKHFPYYHPINQEPSKRSLTNKNLDPPSSILTQNLPNNLTVP